jgi:hypothetical protein
MMCGQHTARGNVGQTELAIADIRQVLKVTEPSSRRENDEEELRAPGVEP